MKFEVRKAGDVTRLILNGSLSGKELSGIGDTIKREIDNSASSKIIIDLSNVSMIDSAVIGFLIIIYKTVTLRRGTIAFINPNASVKNTLHNLGLTRVFKLYESEDAAIKAI